MRITTTSNPLIVGQLRDWREVFLNDTSYFRGILHGKPHVTGFVVMRLDRGPFWIVKTVGGSAYLLYKKKEFKG